VLLAHGMAEHAGRYGRFAAALNAAGYAVYAFDHRGHGLTAGDAHGLTAGGGQGKTASGALGHAAPSDGWNRMVADLAQAASHIANEQPGKPLLLFGHSMGSFAAQIYVLKHSGLIDGLVFSGSACLDLLPASNDPKGASLEAFNAPFEPARTKFDWLSRDPHEVDKYVADPLCGFTATPSSMQSLFSAAGALFVPGALKHVRHDLPIYIFSGDKDPVNGGLAWLRPLGERYRDAGVRDVTADFYKDGRHEMLNETNRAEVVAKLGSWIERVLAR